ncbi:MAG: hypothetical protein ACYCX2_12250 [Christensenellales bacterium]
MEDSFDGTPEVYAPKEYEKALPTVIDRSGNEAVALGVEQGDGGQMALRLSDGTVQNISAVFAILPEHLKKVQEG